MIRNFQPVEPSALTTLPHYMLSDIADLKPNPNPSPFYPIPARFPHIPARAEKPMLQKVAHRRPVPFMPYAHVPDYLLCYVIESLECGHKLEIFPQSDPLIAVRRDCKKCDPKVIQFPSPASPKKFPERKIA